MCLTSQSFHDLSPEANAVRHDLQQARFRRLVELAEHGIKPAVESLRPGLSYTLKVPQIDTPDREYRNGTFLKGDCNLHLPLVFADGVEWLVRVDFSRRLLLGDTLHQFRTAEVAAMRAARELVPDLVPSVHIAGSQDSELLYLPL